jgi:hypothetical protein
MKREKISGRSMATHISLSVEPTPERPIVARFEMNDDGCQSPGLTLGRAIVSAYPSAAIELLLLDLLETVVLSDQYEEATQYLDESEAEGIDRLRTRLIKVASYWREHRDRLFDAHQARQRPEE